MSRYTVGVLLARAVQAVITMALLIGAFILWQRSVGIWVLLALLGVLAALWTLVTIVCFSPRHKTTIVETEIRWP